MSQKTKHIKPKGTGLLSFACFTGCLTLIDQLTKYAAENSLRNSSIAVIPGVFELHYLQNRGAAFGILQNRQWIFVVFALAITVGAALLYPRIKKQHRYTPLRLVCCLMASGAVGNMIDRLFRGYVVDFLYVSLIDFPVFNVADIYVTCGCLLLLVCVLFIYKDDDRLINRSIHD